MNWGTKIVIAFSIFLTAAISTAVFFMTQKVDIVTDNYYDKELKYQEQINRLERTKNLPGQIKIENLGNSVKIVYPNIPDKNTGKDFVLLYRPSDMGKDIKIPVSADSARTQIISTERIQKGVWRVQVSWTSAGSEYYAENIVSVK